MAKIVAYEENKLTLQVTVRLTESLIEMEEAILNGCNKIESKATEEALQNFDTDGSPIKLCEVKTVINRI